MNECVEIDDLRPDRLTPWPVNYWPRSNLISDASGKAPKSAYRSLATWYYRRRKIMPTNRRLLELLSIIES